MHGLVNRSLQCFVIENYGYAHWQSVVSAMQLGFENFEAMQVYDDALTFGLLQILSSQLNKPEPEILEDIGVYLVSNEEVASIRRLLRFGGDCYEEFLHSLDDLRERVRLAVPDLEFPHLDLREHGPGSFGLSVYGAHPVFSHVLVGVLRGMADDYGALVVLDHMGSQSGCEIISIALAEPEFTAGNAFELARGGR